MNWIDNTVIALNFSISKIKSLGLNSNIEEGVTGRNFFSTAKLFLYSFSV